MKLMQKPTEPLDSVATPSEADIREYAHHLYVASGWIHGQDLDNWLHAEAALMGHANGHHAKAAHGVDATPLAHEETTHFVI